MENGKQSWRTFKTKDEAEVFWEQEKARMRRGEKPPDMTATFRQAAEDWYAAGVRKGWRASTAKDYRGALDVRLLPVFGDVPIGRLTEQQVEDWLQKLRGELSPRTLSKLTFIGGAVCERARRKFGITRNVFRSLEPELRPERPDIEVYTDEEVWAIVRAAESKQDELIFLLAWRAGLRRGEIPPLQIKDVSLASRRLRVRRNYVSGVITETPKGKRPRSVPLERELERRLATWLKERGNPDEEELLFPADPDDPFDDGGLLEPDQLSARFRVARDAAGIRPLRFHDLRHTYGSRLAMDGVPLWKIGKLMGHRSTQTTEIYAHFAPSDDDADRVDAAFAVKSVPDDSDGDPVEQLRQQLAQMTETLGQLLADRKTAARDTSGNEG